MSERSVGLKVELRALETRMRLQVFDALKNLLRSEAAGGGTHYATASEQRVRRRGGEIAREAPRLRWAARDGRGACKRRTSVTDQGTSVTIRRKNPLKIP